MNKEQEQEKEIIISKFWQGFMVGFGVALFLSSLFMEYAK